MADVTEILDALETDGNAHKADELLPMVYNELHRLAAARLVQEKPGQTLQTSDLVHEAYVRLVGHGPVSFSGRAHFFGAAAEAMRRILIERARRRKTHKHGALMERVELATDVAHPVQVDQDSELLDLDQALDEMREIYPRPMQIVKLRFFGGLSNREIAELLNTSTATVERDWRFARALLQQRLSEHK